MLKIIVADDEFLVLEGIKMLLTDIRVECEIVGYASDGETAWEMVCKKEPDVLITDIKMPRRNGLELIKSCRERFPEMLFVIISGYQEFSYAQKAISMGVMNYIDKPITQDKLEQVLRTAEDIHYRNILKRKDNVYLLQKYDGIVSALNRDAYEEVQQNYENIKQHLKKENVTLKEYKRYLYIFVTLVVGIYYEGTGHDIREKHFPSYHNLHILQSYGDVDDYIDCIIMRIIHKKQAQKQGVSHKTICSLLQYIRENYSQDISLNEIARRADLSPVYLSSLFKEECGVSYVKYLTDLRMQKAKEFLMEGYLVTEVSEMVGYHNYRYFCDLFKKKNGITPGEYKGNIRKRKE